MPTNSEQRAHQVTYHVMQKPISLNIKDDKGAMRK